MTQTTPLFQNGSEVIRADFHLHTKADREFKYFGEENDYIKQYIDALEENNIHVGVITNHNKFDMDEYKALKKAAIKRDILLLPGIELGVKEGASSIHVLFVFNPDEWIVNGTDYISKVLTVLSADTDDLSCGHCGKDLNTCLNKLFEMNKDFFAIFAHVEQAKGLWKECNGAIITPMSESPNFKKSVLGFQKVRSHDTIQKVHSWMGYDLASVEGSDPKSIEEIGKGEKGFIKIGELSYVAVKYAVKDYKNRVFKFLPDIRHSYIKSVKCIGGRFDEQIFYPSAELNTLIGIRGSGKSSLIEIIRYALDFPSSSADSEYKNELVKSVLGSGGKVELEIIDKYHKKYTISRILGESPTIHDENGAVVSITINSIVENPLYFGQKDLALTRQGYEMELLNKIVGEKTIDISQELANIVNQIVVTIEKYEKIAEIPTLISNLETKNADLEHKLKIYKEKGVDEKLKKQTACNDDLVKLQDIRNRLNNIYLSYMRLHDEIDLESLSLEDYSSVFNKEIFAEAIKIISLAVSMLKKIQEQEVSLKGYIDVLDVIIKGLSDKISSLKEEFAQIKREINDDNIDVESYIAYQNLLTKNTAEISTLKEKMKQKDSLKAEMKKLFSRRNELLQNRYQTYKKSIDEINERQNQLQINIEFKGEKILFSEKLRSGFRGTRLQDVKYKEIEEKFSDFAAVIEEYYYNDGEILQKISGTHYPAISEKLHEGYEKFLKCETPDLIKIMYHGKLLSKHSLGQRASALILFILSQNDSDIVIIDQPEDDLDNQVIYKELIQAIKNEKPNVQFIFATHNANIPVLGDAERVVTVESDTENKKIIMEQGTIDSAKTHERIVDIMEGGREAFRLRNEIYTSWNK